MDSEVMWWVGIDWGSREHEVCLLDAGGRRVEQRSVSHDGQALRTLADDLVRRSAGQPERVAVGIEQPRGPIVETLYAAGIAVYSLNPKQLDRFRDRHTVAGAKDDRRDAYVLAQSLMTDMAAYRRVRPLEPELVQLRELVQMRAELTKDVIALGNRLQEQLRRYYPQVATLGSVHTLGWLRALLERAPDPDSARRLRRSTVAAILQRHHVRRMSATDVIAKLRAEPVTLAPGVAEACARHVAMLLARLKLAVAQQAECDHELAHLLKQLRATRTSGATNEKHRDTAIVLSLPGTGTTVGATVLTEAAQLLQDRDYTSLRAQAGIAPVTKQTGQQGKRPGIRPRVMMRRACNRKLRQAIHHLSWAAVQHHAGWRAQYDGLRAKGHNHSRALRGVADRLLRVLMAMLRRGELYDPSKQLPPRPDHAPSTKSRPSSPSMAA